MANKEYQMLFRLGAKVGSDFNGTFTSAQKVLQATQKEIQSLNKQQSNISGYQKQQQSIDKTNERLELYKRQLERLQQESAAAGTKTAEQANKEDALRLKIKNTADTIEQKNRRLEEMRSELLQAGVNVNDLTAESKRLTAQMDDLRKKEEDAAAEAARFGGSGESAFEAVGSALVAAGIASGLKAIADGYGECISTAMEFGGTMSTVEALSSASVSEMAELSATAKELGANTVFTANQSAEAMTYMGMAGWDAQEMMSGMGGVLNLAAAGGEDLATTSDIVTDNLTAFGLKASDTAHFADVLAAASTNSNTSVSIMGETFKSSAAIAGALGYSIEDVSVAVGLMANAGVKGSVAGTALKNTFNGLLNGATLTSQAFGEIEFTAINADGTMKGFGETCQELRGYFEQMTEAERVQNAMTLAGKRGYNGLLAILNATEEDYAKLTANINDCTGAAQRMANIKLDNLQGDVTLAKSAWDGLKMTLGEVYNKELRQLAQLGTKILSGVTEFCEKNPAVVKSIMAIVTEVGLVVGAYTAFTAVKKVKNTLTAVETALETKNAAAAAASATATGAQTAFNTALLASPLVIITGAVAAATAGLIAYREATRQADFKERELNSATFEQNRELDELTSQYDKARIRYDNMSDEALALKYDLDDVTASINAQSFTVGDLYDKIDTLHGSTDDLISSLNGGTEEIDSNYTSARTLAAKLKDLADESDNAAGSQAKIEPIIKRLNELYPTLGLTVDNVKEKLGGLDESIDKAYNTTGLKAKADNAREYYDQLIEQQAELETAVTQAQATYDAAAENYNRTYDSKNWFTLGLDAVAGAFGSSEMEDAENALDEASAKHRTAQQDLTRINEEIERQEKLLESYGGIVDGTSDVTVSAYDAMSFAVEEYSESAQALIQTYNDAYQAAYDSLTGQYALWDEAAEVEEYAAGDINDALASQAKYWSDYNANLDTLAGKYDEIEGLRELVASFADGSKDSVDMIAGLTAEDVTNDDLKAIVENWKNVRAEQEKTAGSLAETKTDFQNQLDELVFGTENSMSAMIEGMNLTDEAKAAASDTIQAYADGIKSGMGSVEDAAALVSNAAKKALGVAADADSESDGSTGVTATPTISTSTGAAIGPRLAEGWSSAQDYAMEIKRQKLDDILQTNDGKWLTLGGYASGTYNAEAGLAIVGERGPELVNFNGGEQVLTAATTNALLSRSSGKVITIAPVFQISGNANESVMRECADQLVEMVKDALRDEDIDTQRSIYA